MMLQFIVRSTGLYLGCLAVTVAFAEGGVDQPVPAQSQVGGFSAISNVYEPTPAPIPQSAATAATPVLSTPACAMPPVAACGQPVETCSQPAVDCQGQCQSGQCGHGGHCGHGRKIHWCCIHTTGDMYPHFPYYPEHHGYYYFRPYNYTNVLLHRSQGLQLGVNPSNPYSVSMLNPVFEKFSQTNLAGDDDYDRLPPRRNSLPSLEELLEKK